MSKNTNRNPHAAKVQTLGPSRLPSRELPDAWFYREHTYQGDETGAVNIQLQVEVEGFMMHYVIDVPARTKHQTKQLLRALAAAAQQEKE